MSSGLIFTVAANGAIARVDVTPAGNVNANGLGSNAWVTLNPIHFVTDDAQP
jgi:hypothetical protein